MGRYVILILVMGLVIGQPIDARGLEQATSPWPPERFASMCNDLVWAVSGRQFSQMPSFTERVNTADGGIDAEWEIEVEDNDRALPTPIVGPGWNVFQYKKRDLIAQGRRRVISNVRSSLKGALENLRRERHRTPDRYILFLNVDLKHDQTISLKKAILEGYEHALAIHVEIIGAAEIAALLNSQPHLRAAYFTPLAFKTWEKANRSHRAQKLFGFDVDLVARQEELSRLRALVDESHVRVVVVTGAHDIGKSRLVLEATSHRPQDAVFALDPRSMRVDDYRNLVAEQSDVVCVVEDPDPDRIQMLVNETLGVERLKIVITLPTSDDAPSASYGTDERIQCLTLGPLNDEASRKLLSATDKRLDFGVQSWILDRAGGNPGILLTAASIGETLRDTRESFETAVGREFAKRIESALGKDALKCAELLSPLTHVGVSGNFESELTLICEIFGDGQWDLTRVLAELGNLERAGLARRGGSFAEITIPFLANYLVTVLLRGRRDEILVAFFARLHEPGRVRLIRRLSQITTPEVDRFWDALFEDPPAPFGSLGSALRQEQMLRFIAGATPERTLRLLERELLKASHEERLSISGEHRRELMWALEQLLFRATTSRRALTLIWLLAEAETEKLSNNATGVLSECFHPLHEGIPLQLSERLDALQEFTSEKAPKEGRLIAIQAAAKALGRLTYSPVSSIGVEPLDKRPPITYEDFFDYVRELVDHFLFLADTADSEVADSALRVLPRLVADLGFQAQPREALRRFERLVEWAKTEKSGLDIFSLSEKIVALRESLKRHLQKTDLRDDQKKQFEEYVDKANHLIETVEKGSFSIRFKRWTSGWSRQDLETMVVDGEETYRSEVELIELAKETLSNPAFLSNELISWILLGYREKSSRYFFSLGNQDSQGLLRSRIEKIGSQANGANTFAEYWGGWAKRDRAQAERRLIELANMSAVTSEAFASAAGYLGPSEALVTVIKERVATGLIAPKLASGILYGDWISRSSEQQFLGMLREIAGDHLENSNLAIDALGRWLIRTRPIDGELAEFAWQCLESMPAITFTSREAYELDAVAARLSESNVDRGFRLLEKLLRRPYDRNFWNPIDRYGVQEPTFWDVLHEADPERAIRAVVSAAADSDQRFWITWLFKDLVNQEKDSDVLIKLAIENEQQAEIIAATIATSRPGFWPIAFKIIEKYPAKERIQIALTGGIEQVREVHSGSYSTNLESYRKEIERVLSDQATPAAARPWLQGVLAGLESDVNRNIVWEYDRDVNDLRRSIEDKDSPERIWAIGRVLKFSDLKDIRRLLTVEDIAEVLPQVDLPEKKRKALERALEVWQGGT